MRAFLLLAILAAAQAAGSGARAADMTQKIDLGGVPAAKIQLNHVELQRGETPSKPAKPAPAKKKPAAKPAAATAAPKKS